MNYKQKQIAENALDKITGFYSNKKASLSTPTVDGRINSASNEAEVLNDIDSFFLSNNRYIQKNGLLLYKPNTTDNREWYDFAIQSSKDSSFFVPVNIKVTELKGADNLSCKLGVFWALSGVLPASVGLNNSCGWDKYFKLLSENIKSQDSDYYFFVVDKSNTENVFWTGLKSLERLTPNSNNLPFQCDWSKNQTRKKRTFDEAKDFILTAFQGSIYREKKRELFDEYITPLIGLPSSEKGGE